MEGESAPEAPAAAPPEPASLALPPSRPTSRTEPPSPQTAIHVDPVMHKLLGSTLGGDEVFLDSANVSGIVGLNMKKLFNVDTDALQLLFHTIIRSLQLQTQALAQVKADNEARCAELQATIESQAHEIHELRQHTDRHSQTLFDLSGARVDLADGLELQRDALFRLEQAVESHAADARATADAVQSIQARLEDFEQNAAAAQEQHALLAQQVDGLEERLLAQTPAPPPPPGPAGARSPSSASTESRAASAAAAAAAVKVVRSQSFEMRLGGFEGRIRWLTESVQRLAAALKAVAMAPPGTEARDVLAGVGLPLTPPDSAGPGGLVPSRRPSNAPAPPSGGLGPEAAAQRKQSVTPTAPVSSDGFQALLASKNIEARLEAVAAQREEELAKLHAAIKEEFETRLAGAISALESRLEELLRAENRKLQSLLDKKVAAEEFARLSIVMNEFGKNLSSAVEEYRETGRLSAEGIAEAAARLAEAERRMGELEEGLRAGEEARLSDRAVSVRIGAQATDALTRTAALAESKADWADVVALVNRQAAVQAAEKADKAYVQAALRKVVLKLDAAAVVLGDCKGELREHDAVLAKLLDADGAAAARMHFRCLSCDKYQPRPGEQPERVPQFAAFPASPSRNPNLVASHDGSPPGRERPVPPLDVSLARSWGGPGAQSARSPQPPQRVKPSTLRPLYSPTLRALVEEGSLKPAPSAKEERAGDAAAYDAALDILSGPAAAPAPAPPPALRAPTLARGPGPGGPAAQSARRGTGPAGFAIRDPDSSSRSSARGSTGGVSLTLSGTSASNATSGRHLAPGSPHSAGAHRPAPGSIPEDGYSHSAASSDR